MLQLEIIHDIWQNGPGDRCVELALFNPWSQQPVGSLETHVSGFSAQNQDRPPGSRQFVCLYSPPFPPLVPFKMTPRMELVASSSCSGWTQDSRLTQRNGCPPSLHTAYHGSSKDTAMLTPETKATTYATGAVGTAASKIAKGTIIWGDRHTSWSLHLLSGLVLSFPRSPL